MVLTKADTVADMPAEIAAYVRSSPSSTETEPSFHIPRYLDDMRTMNQIIMEWLSNLPGARNTINFARMKGIEMRFSLTGLPMERSGPIRLNRSVDPLMWLLFDRDV